MSGTHSETEIIKQIVKRGLTQGDREEGKEWTEQDQLKLSMKIWTALSKLIRS